MSTCANGWHVVLNDGQVVFVRAATRLRDAHGTCVYRVAPAPDDQQATTIWAHGDKGVPWTCAICGLPIAAPENQPRQREPVFAALPGDWDTLSEQERDDAVDRLADDIYDALRGGGTNDPADG